MERSSQGGGDGVGEGAARADQVDARHSALFHEPLGELGEQPLTPASARELNFELAGRHGPWTTGVRSERPLAPDMCHEMARAGHASAASPKHGARRRQLPVGQRNGTKP
jgi:hypothetical protein